MSSEALSRQVPINGTVSYVVPPGSETNQYYIPLSNLPFQTSWQQLKDHVRTVCSSVERVEIFGGSTSGWVLVKGRENFDAAMACMVSPASEYQTHAPAYNYAEMFPGWSPEAAAAAGNYTADQPHYSSVTMEQYPYDASYHQSAHHHQYQVGSNGYAYADYAPPTKSYSASAAAAANGGGVVHTTRRKIIIRHLPSWATVHQVQDLIRHKSGISADKIQQIDLPLLADGSSGSGSSSSKTNRGYATVTLETEDAASRAIRKLHGYKYDSRTPLAVEHTKEGVSENEGAAGYRPPTRTTTRPHHSHHHHHRGDGGREREKRDSKKDREGSLSSSSHSHSHHHHSSSTAAADNKKGSSSSNSKSHHHKSDVIIAHGSTRPPK
ncbi:hypothetical protein SLS62_008216 [Diatrype stigma]|uniref:RRM domain-containing protein n=1 Tax=Diatrype stigma TaxID=117547 RepID=A0AAN9UJC6_9PEZI